MALRDGLAAAGRDLAELELVGGMRAVFPDDSSPSPLEPAIASHPGAARARLHDVLHQALAVRRRPRSLPGLVSRGGGAGRGDRRMSAVEAWAAADHRRAARRGSLSDLRAHAPGGSRLLRPGRRPLVRDALGRRRARNDPPGADRLVGDPVAARPGDGRAEHPRARRPAAEEAPRHARPVDAAARRRGDRAAARRGDRRGAPRRDRRPWRGGADERVLRAGLGALARERPRARASSTATRCGGGSTASPSARSTSRTTPPGGPSRTRPGQRSTASSHPSSNGCGRHPTRA